jgi:catechol 2,3-dioxygenase
MNGTDTAVQNTETLQGDVRRGPPVALTFRHIGLCTMDLVKMEDFYTRVLGMTVTDRGHETQMDLVFLSRDPRDHHQIVLSSGRPVGLPSNADNPMFGPVINQISFQLGSLDDLKAMNAFLDREYPEGNRFYANHGNTWSIYVGDPEGNLIELYADSPWFCSQPMMKPLDLSLSKDEIFNSTEVIAREGEQFMPHEQWRSEIAKKMGGN